MLLLKRFLAKPHESFFLLGPRGTGKSSLLQTTYPHALWLDLLHPETLRTYSARPERLFDLLKANPEKKTVVIDEIQKTPPLLNVVHAVIEEKRGVQFILSGSSSRKLKRSGANLLGGRALQRHLHPFMAAELGSLFSLDTALQIGMLPLLLDRTHPLDTLHAYVSLYLKEEIQAEGMVRNLENFLRFLESISFSHASLLNIANVAQECHVKRKTVENYVDILEELLLAFRLPIFAKRAKRELSAHPKFYLFDAGVFRVLRHQGPLDSSAQINGAALEGLVAHHLRAWNDYSSTKHEIGFWRTRSGLEVDFIVYGPSGIWAVEVKHATKVHATDLKGLKAFLSDYPMAQPILLYRGSERIQQDGVLCLPCEQFLSALVPNQAPWTQRVF